MTRLECQSQQAILSSKVLPLGCLYVKLFALPVIVPPGSLRSHSFVFVEGRNDGTFPVCFCASQAHRR